MLQRFAAFTLVAMTMCGCGHPKPLVGPQDIAIVEDLDPLRSPGAKATLVLGGVPIEATVQTRVSGSRYEISLVAYGQVCEIEGYESLRNRFSLTQAGGETYDPPLELLRFPLKLGEQWEWKGSMRSGGVANKASAVVHSRADTQYVFSAPVNSVRIDVELTLTKIGGREAKRELTFWFAKDRGLFQRKFGASSERSPSGP